jgi:hypothetical protein
MNANTARTPQDEQTCNHTCAVMGLSLPISKQKTILRNNSA